MRRLAELLAHYRRLWRGAALFAMVLCWGCSSSQAPTYTEADLHKKGCTKAGETIIALTEGETEQLLRLENLAHQDEDCRAVFGDAGVTITLATEGGAP